MGATDVVVELLSPSTAQVDRQAMLAERDLLMRRITAERDPGNALAEKIFGAELANQLIRSLWSKEYE